VLLRRGTGAGKEQRGSEPARCGAGGSPRVCTRVRAGVTFRLIRACLSTWMCTSMRVCAWIYVSMRVSARVYAVVHVCEHGHGTRVHACALACAAGLCVQANTSTPAPRTSCCRPQAGTRVCARVTVAPPDPAHGRTDGRTDSRSRQSCPGEQRKPREAANAAGSLRMLRPPAREDAWLPPGFPALPGGRVGQDVRPRAWTPPGPPSTEHLGSDSAGGCGIANLTAWPASAGARSCLASRLSQLSRPGASLGSGCWAPRGLGPASAAPRSGQCLSAR